jgi:hypothetical protein
MQVGVKTKQAMLQLMYMEIPAGMVMAGMETIGVGTTDGVGMVGTETIGDGTMDGVGMVGTETIGDGTTVGTVVSTVTAGDGMEMAGTEMAGDGITAGDGMVIMAEEEMLPLIIVLVVDTLTIQVMQEDTRLDVVEIHLTTQEVKILNLEEMQLVRQEIKIQNQE